MMTPTPTPTTTTRPAMHRAATVANASYVPSASAATASAAMAAAAPSSNAASSASLLALFQQQHQQLPSSLPARMASVAPAVPPSPVVFQAKASDLSAQHQHVGFAPSRPTSNAELASHLNAVLKVGQAS
jgi:hypothetical protein